jgi:segregation and condensation protein A
LMRRLKEYQRYRDAAFELRMKEHDRQQVFVRGGQIELDDSIEEKELVDASVFDLLKAYQKILDTKLFEKDYEIKITEMSVTAQIQHIMEILNASESVTFESLFTVLNTKQEVVVTFLAILELMRLKLLRVQQTRHFETIRIYKSVDQETQDSILQDYHRSMDSEPSDS